MVAINFFSPIDAITIISIYIQLCLCGFSVKNKAIPVLRLVRRLNLGMVELLKCILGKALVFVGIH